MSSIVRISLSGSYIIYLCNFLRDTCAYTVIYFTDIIYEKKEFLSNLNELLNSIFYLLSGCLEINIDRPRGDVGYVDLTFNATTLLSNSKNCYILCAREENSNSVQYFAQNETIRFGHLYFYEYP